MPAAQAERRPGQARAGHGPAVSVAGAGVLAREPGREVQAGAARGTGFLTGASDACTADGSPRSPPGGPGRPGTAAAPSSRSRAAARPGRSSSARLPAVRRSLCHCCWWPLHKVLLPCRGRSQPRTRQPHHHTGWSRGNWRTSPRSSGSNPGPSGRGRPRRTSRLSLVLARTTAGCRRRAYPGDQGWLEADAGDELGGGGGGGKDDPDRERHVGDPGLDRRVVQNVLEVERDEEEHREQGHADQQPDDVRSPQRPQAEDREWHDAGGAEHRPLVMAGTTGSGETRTSS